MNHDTEASSNTQSQIEPPLLILGPGGGYARRYHAADLDRLPTRRWLAWILGAAAVLLLAASAFGSSSVAVNRNSKLDNRKFLVTAYCPCTRCCGPAACGVTASGARAVGLIVAAPKGIPFGTVLDVPGYGRAVVRDRGGAITAGRLDVLFPTHRQALQWGVRRLPITIQRTAARRSPEPAVLGRTKLRASAANSPAAVQACSLALRACQPHAASA